MTILKQPITEEIKYNNKLINKTGIEHAHIMHSFKKPGQLSNDNCTHNWHMCMYYPKKEK